LRADPPVSARFERFLGLREASGVRCLVKSNPPQLIVRQRLDHASVSFEIALLLLQPMLAFSLVKIAT